MKWFKRNPPEPEPQRLSAEPTDSFFRRGSAGYFFVPDEDFWAALARLEERVAALEARQ